MIRDGKSADKGGERQGDRKEGQDDEMRERMKNRFEEIFKVKVEFMRNCELTFEESLRITLECNLLTNYSRKCHSKRSSFV